jgi:hypothetical protein
VTPVEGETETLKAGSSVKVKISKTPFYAVSTLISSQD